MAIDPEMLSLLVCPVDRGPLLLVDDEHLYNPRLRRLFEVRHGVPRLLPESGVAVLDGEHDIVVSRAAAGHEAVR